MKKYFLNFNNYFIITDEITYEEFIAKYRPVNFAGDSIRKVVLPKCESFYKHPKILQLLRSNDTYDLVFTGALFGEESALVFGYLFKAPTVALMPMGTYCPTDLIMGNPSSLAFSPQYLDFAFTDKMTLLERVLNVLSGTASFLLYHWYDLPGQDDILRRHASFLSPPAPPVKRMAEEIALAFANVHPNFGYPKPLPPNVVLIGGINVDSNISPLPQVRFKIFTTFKGMVWYFCLVSYMTT